MIGYKAFNSDLTCRGFQYEIGKSYEMDGEISICERGFHFCKNIEDCLWYYSNQDARFAKVEAYGNVIDDYSNSKCVTNKIRILEEIPRDEAIKMSNTGHHNAGHHNSGDYNSGDWNSGDCNPGFFNTGHYNTGNCNSGDYNTGRFNSGDHNTGNRNSGYYNSGDYNSGYYNFGDWNSGDWNRSSYNNGCFMTTNPLIMMFNKPTNWTLNDWGNSNARRIMSNCPTENIDFEWIVSSKMTTEEKTLYPEYTTAGGYLKKNKCKLNRQEWWDKLTDNEKAEVMSLPNFDPDVFYECTGIQVKKE